MAEREQIPFYFVHYVTIRFHWWRGANLTTETIEYRGQTFPVIRCKENKQKQTWSFYCQYCKTFHRHGAGEGHRNAHCHNSSSPYYMKGYYLKLEGMQ